MADGSSKPGASDVTSRLAVVLTALNPILLLVIGYVINADLKAADAKIDAQKAAIDQLKVAADTASVNNRIQVDKVKVISDFLDDLTGEHPARQRVAMQAIQIVLPAAEAERILEAIRRTSDPKSNLAAEATKLLDRARHALLEDMFAPDQRTRSAALHALKRDRLDDELIIDKLLDRVSQDVDARTKNRFPDPAKDGLDYQRRASIYNTADFLSAAIVSNPALQAKIVRFADAAKENSADTRARADAIRKRFPLTS